MAANTDVIQMNGLVIERIRDLAKFFLEKLICDAINITEHQRDKVVMASELLTVVWNPYSVLVTLISSMWTQRLQEPESSLRLSRTGVHF